MRLPPKELLWKQFRRKIGIRKARKRRWAFFQGLSAMKAIGGMSAYCSELDGKTQDIV
jgi:hypothetical protein